MERRWAATSNLTYEPAENRRGVYATLAMIGALAVLSALMFAAAPGDTGGQAPRQDSGGGGADPGSPERAAPPEDPSFPCEAIGYSDVRLSAEEKDRLQEATERFVLTAYGDPGSDPAAYERDLEGLVVPECFWRSQAGGYAEGVEEVARAGEAAPPSSRVFAQDLAVFDFQRANRVTDYESGAEYVEAEVEAVWVSREAEGELVGKQELLRFARQAGGGEDWKVTGGLTLMSGTGVYPEHQHAVDEKIEEIEDGG